MGRLTQKTTIRFFAALSGAAIILLLADSAAYGALIAVERPVTTFVGAQAEFTERIKPIEGLDVVALRTAYSNETPGKYQRRDNYEGAAVYCSKTKSPSLCLVSGRFRFHNVKP